MRRPILLLLACAATAAGCGSDEGGGGSPERATAPPKPVAGVPPELARVRREAGRLLDGGKDAFERRLGELRGHPVVVNKWASWCPPCRAEFPYFARQADRRAKTVAFLGVDANDNDSDAREFLKKLPVPYPSYKDPDLEVSAAFRGVQAFPTTAFYDSKGKLAYVKQGGYASESKLAEDLERYAR
jgi:cytochrome c biogenesis protein CcmG, thiol:disulfide interchange protein DsbE